MFSFPPRFCLAVLPLHLHMEPEKPSFVGGPLVQVPSVNLWTIQSPVQPWGRHDKAEAAQI